MKLKSWYLALVGIILELIFGFLLFYNAEWSESDWGVLSALFFLLVIVIISIIILFLLNTQKYRTTVGLISMIIGLFICLEVPMMTQGTSVDVLGLITGITIGTLFLVSGIMAAMKNI